MVLHSSLHGLFAFSELIRIIGPSCPVHLQIPGEEDSNKVNSSSPEERIEPASDTGESDMQEYYEKMLKENPTDPLLLKNYARFLKQVRMVMFFLVFNHIERSFYRVMLSIKKALIEVSALVIWLI